MRSVEPVSLVYKWFRHHNRMFWRTPVAAFFTFALPLLMLVMFASLISGDFGEGDISFVDFYVPALACFTAASATYTNLSVTLAIYREEQILKRVRATPLAPWQYLLASVLSGVWIALLGSTLLFVLGIFAYGANIHLGQLGWMAAFFVVGVLAFAVLGAAISTFAKSTNAAPAVANATILPLAFISGIFIRLEDPPRWLDILGSIFPLKPFSEGFRSSFDPSLRDGRIYELLYICVWGLAGFIFLIRYFKWVPSPESE